MRYYLLAVATATLLLAGCGVTPVKPPLSSELKKLDALYGEAVIIYRNGSPESRSNCAKAKLDNNGKRACALLPTSDEVTLNLTSTFWGGVSKFVLLVPGDQNVHKGDIVKFHTRDSVFGFVKIAARAGDPNCKWESGLIKGATAQGVVCDDYDYRTVLDVIDRYR